jgi:hypothetical protein
VRLAFVRLRTGAHGHNTVAAFARGQDSGCLKGAWVLEGASGHERAYQTLMSASSCPSASPRSPTVRKADCATAAAALTQTAAES